MNKNARAGIKKAAGLTAAGQKQLHKESYQKSAQLSSLKILIGEFLLFGNKQRKEFWWLFESKLRNYVDQKISGGLR